MIYYFNLLYDNVNINKGHLDFYCCQLLCFFPLDGSLYLQGISLCFMSELVRVVTSHMSQLLRANDDILHQRYCRCRF